MTPRCAVRRDRDELLFRVGLGCILVAVMVLGSLCAYFFLSAIGVMN